MLNFPVQADLGDSAVWVGDPLQRSKRPDEVSHTNFLVSQHISLHRTGVYFSCAEKDTKQTVNIP